MRPKTKRKIGMTFLGWFVGAACRLPDLLDDARRVQDRDRRRRDAAAAVLLADAGEFAEVRSRADYPVFCPQQHRHFEHRERSYAIVIALPAAYAMAFHPSRHTKDLLLWMLSTKMMPAIGVLIPIYLAYRELHLLDTFPA